MKVKPSHQIPEHALTSIKSIKVRVDRDGNSTLDLELYDKVGVLRILAKASGLLDTPEESDKPSVIGINVHAPDQSTGRVMSLTYRERMMSAMNEQEGGDPLQGPGDPAG